MINIVSKIVLILVFYPFISFSQNINMDGSIDYLNKKLDGICKIDTKKNELIISFYKDDIIYREDRVDFQEIDTAKIYYDNTTKSLTLKCYGNEKSVCKRLIQDKTKGYYSRINITYDADSISTNGVKQAFIHLVKLTQDDNYKNDKPFE